MDTFETKAGVTLALTPVKVTMLRHLLRKFGGIQRVLDDPEGIRKLEGRARSRAAGAVDQLINYCIGFGVTTDPTEEELDELAELGFSVDKSHLARVSWLRLLLEDDEEIGELMGAVMVLTMGGVEEVTEEPTDDEMKKRAAWKAAAKATPIEELIGDDKDLRIAALEAQLAALAEDETTEENGS